MQGPARSGWLVCRAKEAPANLLPHPFPDPSLCGQLARGAQLDPTLRQTPESIMPAAPWHHCPPHRLLFTPVCLLYAN